MSDLIRPVPGVITQPFGGTYSGEPRGYINTAAEPDRGKRAEFPGGVLKAHIHLAIDWKAALRTPFHAMGTGPIVRQGLSHPDLATYLQQRVWRGPNFDFHMLYYHLTPSSLRFALGHVLHQGDVPGLTGCSGWCDGPHIHTDLVRMARGANPDTWYGSLHIDPQPFIAGKAHFADMD